MVKLSKLADGGTVCPQERPCAVRRHGPRAARAVRSALEALTLAQLHEPERGLTSTVVFRPRGTGA